MTNVAKAHSGVVNFAMMKSNMTQKSTLARVTSLTDIACNELNVRNAVQYNLKEEHV